MMAEDVDRDGGDDDNGHEDVTRHENEGIVLMVDASPMVMIMKVMVIIW